MKTIKIKLCDWHDNYVFDEIFFIKALRKHYNIELSDDPDYVFYSVWGTEHLDYDCVKIYYTAEDISPDFNLCDYAIGFDDLSFGDRYIRFSLFPIVDCFPDAARKHIFTEEELKRKTKFCNYIVSNGNCDPIRTEVFNRLSDYKKVDSGGRYMNNIGCPVKSKLDFQKDYKFSIAFENGAMKGYTTEKIIDAFASKTIPIYWGNPDIAKDFNPKSFVNYWDYGNLDDMIKRVIEIDQNDDLYREILSEPIFENGEIPERFRYETIEKFLLNIFEQPYEKAFRRSFHTWRRVYIDDMKYNRSLVQKSKKFTYRVCDKLFF